jgi:hypothetical protein
MASLNNLRTTIDMEETLKTTAERAIRYVQTARERNVGKAPVPVGIDRSQIIRNPIASLVGKDCYRMIDASTI